jgi:hypothetical protein
MVHKKMTLHANLAICVCLILFLSSCAEVQTLHQGVLKSMRSPGEVMEASPEDTSQTYLESCKYQGRYDPVYIEAEVIPIQIPDGDEVNHRIRYAICKSSRMNMNGEIIRKVYHGGTAVFQDRTRYEFKQGTWIVDAFIKVPKNAPAGKYEVDTIISYAGKSRHLRSVFEVKKRGDN